MHRIALVALGAIAVSLALWARHEPAPEPPSGEPRAAARGADPASPATDAPPAGSTGATAQAPDEAGVGAADEPTALAPALAPSLTGTEVDGALVVDASGRFVPTPSALRLFDHFLTATGEVPTEAILARIEQAIAALPASARADARALLADHLAYREAARALHAEGLGDADLATRHQRLRELRRGIFGADVATALFGEEERRARLSIALRRIETDPDLSPAEKAARREALEAELPERVRDLRRRATAPAALARREAALRTEGASPGEIRALREAEVGPEAAERLEALDAQRAAWDRRLAAYRRERDALLDDAAGPDAARALDRLRHEHFTGGEVTRVEALDRIDGVTPSG